MSRRSGASLAPVSFLYCFKATALALGATLILAVAFEPAASRKIASRRPQYTSSPSRTTLPPDLRGVYGAAPWAAQPADTFVLGKWTFDTAGAPDPQDWTTVDRTAQIDTFFHVADVTELDGGTFGSLTPLEGAHSLWCGLAASSAPPYCGYDALPGYGNSWDQTFESVPMEVSGDVTLSYQVRWDSEPGYDWTVVQYADTNGSWVSLPVNGGAGEYQGAGALTEGFTIPAAAIGGTARFRFRFTSDSAWSDEDGLWPTDGAILVDSLGVSDASGVVNLRDFEAEAPGAMRTVDGAWFAGAGPAYGDFAALYPGFMVLQEDPCAFNETPFWGFFADPSIANYWCSTPPHPEQGAVPYSKYAGDGATYLDNAIESPLIEYAGTGDEVKLTFSVYRGLPLDAMVFYVWWVRSWVDGCPAPWRNDGFVHYGDQHDWYRATFDAGYLIDPNASHIQVAIACFDGCAWWYCWNEECHTQAPLIDNVELRRVDVHGPQFSVRHIDLFQDTFAADGSLTGTARADMAIDIASWVTHPVQPGDSLVATLSGVGEDALSGSGPAAYAYVTVWPPGQPGKAGTDLEAPEVRDGGKRFPLVETISHDGQSWYRFRMDTVFTEAGAVVADRYCFDLNDTVFTPGDTICYVLAADDGAGNVTCWSRRLDGQGVGFTTDDLAEALTSPCEFTILPAGGWRRGGTVLYVDGADDRGGPAQLYFDSAFDPLGIRSLVDRYDVLGPSSHEANSLAGRVQNVANQIVGCYQTILWDTGEISRGSIGDGTGNPDKSDDYGLIATLLDTGPDNPGVYLSGDDVAYGWDYLSGAGAIAVRATFMNHNILADDHITRGIAVTPRITGVAAPFTTPAPDTMYAYGGCPGINDFDVLAATGASEAAMIYPNGDAAVLVQETPNTAGSVARVVLSGFAFQHIRDDRVTFPIDRVDHLATILTWLRNVSNPPVVVGGPAGIAEFLDQNAPNPFNPVTTIRYGIREREHVTLRIYNVAGQVVRTLVNEVQSPRPGGRSIGWDGLSDGGGEVASGVYFYKLTAGNFTRTRKMVVLR